MGILSHAYRYLTLLKRSEGDTGDWTRIRGITRVSSSYLHRSPVFSVFLQGHICQFPAWQWSPTVQWPWLAACECSSPRHSGALFWCWERFSSPLRFAPWSCFFLVERWKGWAGMKKKRWIVSLLSWRILVLGILFYWEYCGDILNFSVGSFHLST